MKIWILNHYATSPGSIGISRHYDLSKYLVDLGNEVTIFASSFNHQTRKEEHIQEKNKKFQTSEYNKVKFIWFKTMSYSKNDFRRVVNILDYSYKLFKFLKNTTKEERPDVIVGSLMHPLTPIIGLYFSKKWNKKFIFEERDMWPQSLVDLGKMKENNPLVYILGKVENYLYKQSDRIIFLFDKSYLYAISKGVSKEKIIYIPNGVNLSRIEESNNLKLPLEINEYFVAKKDKIIGIYSGAHSLANDLDSLLDGIKEVDERYEFIFIGDGPEKENLKTRVNNERINNITFFDAVTKDNLYQLLKRCDFGMIKFKDLPVYKWGVSPNKIYDYMGTGLPIILGLNDKNHIIQQKNAGIVIASDFEKELPEILKQLNKQDFQYMGKNSFELAKKNFSWKILSNTLNKELKKLNQGDNYEESV